MTNLNLSCARITTLVIRFEPSDCFAYWQVAVFWITSLPSSLPHSDIWSNTKLNSSNTLLILTLKIFWLNLNDSKFFIVVNYKLLIKYFYIS